MFVTDFLSLYFPLANICYSIYSRLLVFHGENVFSYRMKIHAKMLLL